MTSHNQILYDGTGIPKIIRAMQANGSSLPRFDTDEDRTYFTTFLPIHASALNFTPQAGDQAGDQVSLLDVPEHPTPPAQKYVTTPLGLASLRQLEESKV